MATILIVDDEKNIRAHLATYLRGPGHAAEAAADARGGARRARSSRARRRPLRRAHGGHGRPGAAARDPRPPAGRRGRADDGLRDGARRGRGDARRGLRLPREAVRRSTRWACSLDRVLEVRQLRRENRDAPPAWSNRRRCSSRATSRCSACSRPRGRSRRRTRRVLLTGESGTGKNVLARRDARLEPASRRARSSSSRARRCPSISSRASSSAT